MAHIPETEAVLMRDSDGQSGVQLRSEEAFLAPEPLRAAQPQWLFNPVSLSALSVPPGVSLHRSPSLWTAFWPPPDTRRRITPCWAPTTSSTSEEARTQPTCPDLRSATTSWAAWRTWVWRALTSPGAQTISCSRLQVTSLSKRARKSLVTL